MSQTSIRWKIFQWTSYSCTLNLQNLTVSKKVVYITIWSKDFNKVTYRTKQEGGDHQSFAVLCNIWVIDPKYGNDLEDFDW